MEPPKKGIVFVGVTFVSALLVSAQFPKTDFLPWLGICGGITALVMELLEQRKEEKETQD